MGSWHGIFAPRNTPRDIIDRLQAAVVSAVHRPEVRQRVESTGNEIVASTPAEFDARFKADVARFKRIVADAHIPYQD